MTLDKVRIRVFVRVLVLVWLQECRVLVLKLEAFGHGPPRDGIPKRPPSTDVPFRLSNAVTCNKSMNKQKH